MNPGICYLYEYEKNRRKRNVGFLKIARHYQSCILQIRARGIAVGNGASLELWTFYVKGDQLIGSQIATLTCFGRTVSARIPVSENHFPESRALGEIDGFLIKLPGSASPVFWAASEKNFPAALEYLRPAGQEEEPSENAAEPEEESSENAAEPQEGSQPEESSTAPVSPVPTEAEDEESPEDSEAISSDAAASSASGTKLTARKIQRSDISSLPRRFWFLANNSFLLHGYHNYNHLLLVEEDGHIWLGVPGIYDVREARAADLFGFPQFTRSYAPMLNLEPGERNDEADFGHWCRYLDPEEKGR